MANEEHLRILREGVNRWNQWRKDNSEIEPDLRGAKLSSLDFFTADFSGANLSSANLTYTDLSDSNLSYADLSYADFTNADLTRATFSSANLSYVNLRGTNVSDANLSDADLRRANLSKAGFRRADLSNANLSRANLSRADLSNADLSNANLSHASLNGTNLSHASLNTANLWRTQALGTNFQGAELTGINIEDCHDIISAQLDDVVCNYVFFKGGQRERRPSDRSKIFAPGDFAKLVQKSLETVDLFFRRGINWKAFALSLEDLRVEYEGQDLSIQAIENKNDGTFVIRLNVPPDADKEAIERQAEELYETRLAVLEAQYQGKLKAKSKELNSFRRELQEERRRNTWMEEIIQTMAEKENSKYDLRYSKFGGGFAGNGGMQVGGTFIDASLNQTLVEVAQEMQQIYDQLLQAYPSTTLDEQLEIAKKAIVEVENRPSLKERFVGLLKNGTAEALKEIVNRSGFNIVLEAARGWMNPE